MEFKFCSIALISIYTNFRREISAPQAIEARMYSNVIIHSSFQQGLNKCSTPTFNS
jgi:hypothetical protein